MSQAAVVQRLLLAANASAGSLHDRLEALLAVLVAEAGLSAAELRSGEVDAGPLASAGEPPSEAGDVRQLADLTLTTWPAGTASDAVELAAGLCELTIGRMREQARQGVVADALSSLTHEMNNALTPLLCRTEPAVVREAHRLRSLLDQLRQVRGKAQGRRLLLLKDWLENVRKLLALVQGGVREMAYSIEPEAGQRALGPEQGGLFAQLLRNGYALRAALPPGQPLELGARLSDDRLVLRLAGEVKHHGDVLPALELEAGQGDGPVEVRLVQSDSSLAVEFHLRRRPVVIVIGGADDPLGERIAARLAEHGIEVSPAADPDAAAAACAGCQPWAALLLPDSGVRQIDLRKRLSRVAPMLAMSMLIRLDADGNPVGYAAAPGEVDLRELLA